MGQQSTKQVGLGERCRSVTGGLPTKRSEGREGTLDHGVMERRMVVRSSNRAWVMHKEATTFPTQEFGYAEGPATSQQGSILQDRCWAIGDFCTLSLSCAGSFPRVCFLGEPGLFLAALGWRQLLFALFCSHI